MQSNKKHDKFRLHSACSSPEKAGQVNSNTSRERQTRSWRLGVLAQRCQAKKKHSATAFSSNKTSHETWDKYVTTPQKWRPARLRLFMKASHQLRDGVSCWNIGCQNFDDTGTCSQTSPVGCLFRWKCAGETAGKHVPWSQGLPLSGHRGTGAGDRRATDYHAPVRTGCFRATDCSALLRTGDFSKLRDPTGSMGSTGRHEDRPEAPNGLGWTGDHQRTAHCPSSAESKGHYLTSSCQSALRGCQATGSGFQAAVTGKHGIVGRRPMAQKGTDVPGWRFEGSDRSATDDRSEQTDAAADAAVDADVADGKEEERSTDAAADRGIFPEAWLPLEAGISVRSWHPRPGIRALQVQDQMQHLNDRLKSRSI